VPRAQEIRVEYHQEQVERQQSNCTRQRHKRFVYSIMVFFAFA